MLRLQLKVEVQGNFTSKYFLLPYIIYSPFDEPTIALGIHGNIFMCLI